MDKRQLAALKGYKTKLLKRIARDEAQLAEILGAGVKLTPFGMALFQEPIAERRDMVTRIEIALLEAQSSR